MTTINIPAIAPIILAGGFATVTFGFSYISSISKEQMAFPYYFLSASIDYAPSRNVATLFLSPVMTVCLPLIAITRYLLVKASGRNGRLNIAACLAAFMCAIGGHGVAAFPWSDNNDVHLYFAGLFFTFGIVVAVMQVAIDRTYDNIETNKKSSERTRICSALFGFFLLLAMGLMGIYMLWGAGDNESVIFTFALVEITYVLNLLVVYLSFIPEMLHLRIALSVVGKTELEQLLSPPSAAAAESTIKMTTV